MHLSRRKFLASAAAVAVGSGLAGCASINTQVPQWVAGFQAIAADISLIMPQLANVGLTGATATFVNNLLAEIGSVLSAINNASTVSQGTSVLMTIEQYINTLAPVVLPFVSLIPGGSILGLIIAALPAIEFALNFAVSLLSPTALKVAATAPALPASRMLRGSRPKRAGLSLATSQAYLNMLIAGNHTQFMRRYR